MPRNTKSQQRVSTSGDTSIVATGLALAFGLVTLRFYMSPDGRLPEDALATIGKWVVASYQDLLFSVLLTSIFLAIGWLLPTRRRMVAIIFFAVAFISVLWAAINIEVVRLLGEPVTLNWIYYSDSLRAAIDGVMFALTPHNLLLLFLTAVGFVLGTFVLRSILHRVAARRLFDPIVAVLVLAISAGLIPLFAKDPAWENAEALNPAMAFIRSALYVGSPAVPAGTQQAPNVAGVGPVLAPTPPLKNDRQNVRNVIFFVLESTPAEYIQSYGGTFEVTPNLSSYAAKAFQFDNAYAHVPATNQSLFSLITALYPQVASRGMTQQFPEVNLISIGNILSERGYRTALFNSSDTRFQGSDRFLANKGFQLVEDFRDRKCDTATFHNSSKDWPFMDFTHDRCTVESLNKWIDADVTAPFFALFWTGMTHYPYFGDGPEKQYTSQVKLNRYLNALHTVDNTFGLLMRHLEERGLAKSTLVVLIGDHGEAFGRHGAFLHASDIYEESVHVPMILINETLFSGSRSPVLGGIIDVAPTVLDILGIQPPAMWQGRSMFATTRPQRVFFFTPMKGFPVGFREGSRKFIYYTGTSQMELFDLSTDPQERQNLAPQNKKAADDAKGVLASWVQQQNDYIYHLVSAPQAGEPARSSGDIPVKVTVYASGTKFLTPPKAQLLVDGVSAGYFAAKSAPSNAAGYPSDEAIEATVEPYEFTLSLSSCPRKIEVAFLNDEWAGEGLTGDTNLLIKQIRVNSRIFAKDQMRIEGRIGGVKNGNFWIWQEGKVGVDLTAVSTCD